MPGSIDSQLRLCAGVHRQAASKRRMGRPLARAFQSGHRQRLSGTRVEIPQPQARRHLPAGRPGGGRRMADLQSAAGFRGGGKDPDRGRHFRFGRCLADALRRGAGGKDLLSKYQNSPRYKFIENCEFRLFQRPDEAIHRGMDKQTESGPCSARQFHLQLRASDLPANPRASAASRKFEKFTQPMKRLLRAAAKQNEGYVASSDSPRLVNGKPTQNPQLFAGPAQTWSIR